MAYDLMLLADPGPARAELLRLLRSAPDIRPDPELENRFWLVTEHGRTPINVGTKDPVESVHLELEPDQPEVMEAATRRALALAEQLGMRVEDMQWGREVTGSSLPVLREYWAALDRPARPHTDAAERPWWRFW